MMLCGSRSAALTRTSLVAPTTRTTGVLIELVSMGAVDDLVSATAEAACTGQACDKSRLGRARAYTRPHKLVLVATRCTLVVLVRAVI